MKILVISIAGIGDTLFASPLIKELRKNFPKAEIDLLVMWKSAHSIMKNNPDLSNIHQFNMLEKGVFSTWLFCLKLRRKKYDISINTCPQSRLAYRIISYLIGARERISHKYKNHTIFDTLLVTKEINQTYDKHLVDNNLALLPLLNARKRVTDNLPRIYLSKENLDNAKNFLTRENLNGKKLIGIHVGSGATKNLSLRRWPISNYELLIKSILANHKNARILLFGKEEVRDNLFLLNRIKNNIAFVNTDDILDSCALVEKCKIFISVDSVFMNIASSMKIPLQIVIKTPTFNKTVYPYHRKFIEVGNPLPKGLAYYYDGKGIHGNSAKIKEYMESISPEQVYNKIKNLI